VGAHEEDADRGHGGLPAGGAAGGRDRHLEVEQLAFEPVQVGALARDGRPLRRQDGGEVGIDRAVLQAQPREASGIRRGEAQAPQRDDQRSRARSVSSYSR
jgi:hypothetical protein